MPNPPLTPVPARRRPTKWTGGPPYASVKTSRLSAQTHNAAAAATPPPRTRETTKTTTRSGSEKETPTVIFTKTQSPRVVLNAVRSEDRSGHRLEDNENDDEEGDESSSSSSSSEERPLARRHHEAATNMIQTTLECGIASICRLRRLYPRHFFSKMDVEGTSVTRFDVRVLEECVVVVASGEGGISAEETGMTALSPLTVTQRTHRTALGEGCRRDEDEGDEDHDIDNDPRLRKDARQATEALLLLRWIGTKGVHSILKRNQLARVILGVMVPNNREDELVEQYVFEFGCNQPPHPNSQLALTQARQNMSSFFQNLNGYSAGRATLSQAVVPMMTQGTSCSKSCGTMPSQMFELQTQQSFNNQDDRKGESCDESRCFDPSQKRLASQKRSIASVFRGSSQKSFVESMTQSIKASVKRNRGIRIPKSRYLTLRVEFTESIAASDLPEALKDKNHHSRSKTCVSPTPAEAGFVVTPLGTVAEENCTGLSVAMTAFSKGRMSSDAENAARQLSPLSRVESTSSQLEVDELILEEEGFKPFTQMEFEADHEDGAAGSKSTQVDEKIPHKNKAIILKRKQSEMADPSPTTESRCVSPNESNHLPPGTKAFAVPSGNNGSQTYLKCIVRDHRLGPMGGEQYKVEFVRVSGLFKKKQWIPARKVMRPSDMKKRIESALEKLDGDSEEERIECVAEKVRVCAALVRIVLSKMT